MIKVKVTTKQNAYQSFSVSGHAGYAEQGFDIVCAGVSSAVQMTVNGICEVSKTQAQVSVVKDCICLTLPAEASLLACSFVEALALHLSLMADDYPNHIKFTHMEV